MKDTLFFLSGITSMENSSLPSDVRGYHAGSGKMISKEFANDSN
jgi:hypothetical protein